MMRATRLFSLVVLALAVFTAPAMAATTVPPSFDDSTADTMFLFIAGGPSGLFPGTATTGASYADTVAIFNIGSIAPLGFPFSGVLTPGPIADPSLGFLASDGRQFLFFGGLQVFEPFFFDGEVSISQGEFEGPFGSFVPHVFLGQETDQGSGSLVEPPLEGISQDIQDVLAKMLANMDLLDPALGAPGGFSLTNSFNDVLGLLGDTINELDTSVTLAQAKGPVFDDSFTGLTFDVAAAVADGFEQVFAFDPTQGGRGSLSLTSGGTLTVGYAPVPEPGSLVLFGAGVACVGLVLSRRRRKQAA